jgi:hypothetical protein
VAEDPPQPLRADPGAQAALLGISAMTSVDGVLGFIEYKSSRRLSTNFYEKISRWYREHLMRMT